MSDPLQLFVDGAFHPELRWGAWAFRIPFLQRDAAAAGPGETSQHFELAAVVEGLRALADQDGPVEVNSDCTYVLDWIGKCQRGNYSADIELPLLRELRVVVTSRLVRVRYLPRRDAALLSCHEAARHTLQQAVATDPALSRRLGLLQERSRLQELLREQESLRRRMVKLEKDVRQQQAVVTRLELKQITPHTSVPE